MKYYAHYGHKDFILCLGYRGDAIKNYFLNYNECVSNDFVLSEGGKKLELMSQRHSATGASRSWTPASTSNIGQRLKAVEPHLGDEDGVPRELQRRPHRPAPPELIAHVQRAGQDRQLRERQAEPELSLRLRGWRRAGRADHDDRAARLCGSTAGSSSSSRRSSTTCATARSWSCEPFQRLVAAETAHRLRIRRLLDVDGHVQGPPAARRALRPRERAVGGVEDSQRQRAVAPRVSPPRSRAVLPVRSPSIPVRPTPARCACSVSARIPMTSRLGAAVRSWRCSPPGVPWSVTGSSSVAAAGRVSAKPARAQTCSSARAKQRRLTVHGFRDGFFPYIGGESRRRSRR